MRSLTKIAVAVVIVMVQSGATFAAGPVKSVPPGGPVMIVDATDRVVATYTGEECGTRAFPESVVDFCIYSSQATVPPSPTYYTSTDCSGTAHHFAWSFSGLVSRSVDNVMLLQEGKFVYVALPLSYVTVQSIKSLGVCGLTDGVITTGVTHEVTFASLGFVGPFRIK